MKTKKSLTTIVGSIFMMVLCLTFSSANAQTKTEDAKMKDCCMMKDGKMMVMKDGKTTPMSKDMTMEDGTICMKNGECVMKDGKKMMMKDGDCMEMSGKMCSGKHKMSDDATAVYTCPMHPEVTGVKGGKCPKCGMDLVPKTK